jgi:filamentous hemagglutinin family protein
MLVRVITKLEASLNRCIYVYIAAIILLSGDSHSLPSGVLPRSPKLQDGNATFKYQEKVLTVDQLSYNGKVLWDSFSIGKDASVIINQPSSSSTSLNKVVGGSLSEIAGHLQSNGKVILSNPNGIIFHKGSKVDVGGLIATTKDVFTKDYIHYEFKDVAGKELSRIKVDGNITSKGLGCLVSNFVSNSGVIKAKEVVVASGDGIKFDLYGDELLSFEIDKQVKATLLENQGIIEAGDGSVYITSGGVEGIVDNVVNNEGVIRVESVKQVGDEIVLDAGDNKIQVSGLIENNNISSNKEKTSKIKILGKKVEVKAASIKANGEHVGGEVLVGGNWQGKGPEKNSKMVTVDSATTIEASGKNRGGKVVVFADKDTEFYGQIVATGKIGGDAEISGKERLTLSGHADLRSSDGERDGHLLMDPGDVTIQDGNNLAGPNVYDDAWVASQLAYSNLSISTDNSTAGGSGDITMNSDAAISWTTNNTLSLIAERHITLNGTISHTSGRGHLNLRPDKADTGTGTIIGTGTLTFTGNTDYAMVRTFADTATAIGGTVTVNKGSYPATGNYIQYEYVTTETNLADIGTQSNGKSLAGSYALKNDITLSTNPWVSIGTFIGNFTGDNLAGGKYTLDQYRDSSASAVTYRGFFSRLDGAYVDGLNFTNVNASFTGGTTYVGTVSGYTENSSVISNVSAAGTYGGTSYVAGITGYLTASKILDSSFSGTITCTTSCAGLTGRAYSSSEIRGCTSSGSVTGSSGDYVAGIVGYALNSGIYDTSSSQTVYGAGRYAGGIAGYFSGETMDNCYTTGNVTAQRYYIGGLIGRAVLSTISNNYTTGDVTGNGITSAGSYTGGLIGYTYDTVNISNSYTTGNVSSIGGTAVGGLIGLARRATSVSDVYTTGNVTNTVADGVGGLIGTFDDFGVANSLIRSYATGNVTGDASTGDYVGGLIGLNYSDGGVVNTVQDSYATGNVSGKTTVGGLIGYNQTDASVTNCYATGDVSGTTNVGGAIGVNTGTVTLVYSSGDVGGSAAPAGSNIASGAGTGSRLTPANMKLSASFDAAWDVSGSGSAWQQDDGDSYPYVNTVQYKLSADDTNTRFAQSSAVETQITGYNWTSGGSYYQIIPFKLDGTGVVAYQDTGTGTKNVVYIPDTSTISNNDPTALTYPTSGVKVTAATAATGTISAIAKAGSNATDSDILYTVSGNNITLESGSALDASAAAGYTIDGNINSSAGNDNITINANSNALVNKSTINAGTGDIDLEGSSVTFNNTSLTAANLTLKRPASTVFSLEGTSGFNVNAADLNAMTISGTVTLGRSASPGAFTLGGVADISTGAASLTINGGSFTLGSNALTLDAAETLTFSGGAVTGTGALTANSLAITSSGAVSLTGSNVVTTLAASSSGGDFSYVGAGAVTVGGAINAGANDITLEGTSIDLGSNTITANNLSLHQPASSSFTLGSTVLGMSMSTVTSLSNITSLTIGRDTSKGQLLMSGTADFSSGDYNLILNASTFPINCSGLDVIVKSDKTLTTNGTNVYSCYVAPRSVGSSMKSVDEAVVALDDVVESSSPTISMPAPMVVPDNTAKLPQEIDFVYNYSGASLAVSAAPSSVTPPAPSAPAPSALQQPQAEVRSQTILYSGGGELKLEDNIIVIRATKPSPEGEFEIEMEMDEEL